MSNNILNSDDDILWIAIPDHVYEEVISNMEKSCAMLLAKKADHKLI